MKQEATREWFVIISVFVRRSDAAAWRRARPRLLVSKVQGGEVAFLLLDTKLRTPRPTPDRKLIHTWQEFSGMLKADFLQLRFDSIHGGESQHGETVSGDQSGTRELLKSKQRLRNLWTTSVTSPRIPGSNAGGSRLWWRLTNLTSTVLSDDDFRCCSGGRLLALAQVEQSVLSSLLPWWRRAHLPTVLL